MVLSQNLDKLHKFKQIIKQGKANVQRKVNGWTGKNDYFFCLFVCLFVLVTTNIQYFVTVEKEEILKNLNNLNINKATQNTDISTKIMKENSDIFRDFIFSNPNVCINTSLYPSLLKMGDVTLVHKKDSKSAKNN